MTFTKKEEGFWPGLTQNDKSLKTLSFDWNNYVDSDDEEEEQPANQFGGGQNNLMELLKNKNIGTEDLMKKQPGMDFPKDEDVSKESDEKEEDLGDLTGEPAEKQEKGESEQAS